MVATAVSSDGYREILGVDTFTSEDEAAWTDFLRGLVARGVKGARLVISDAHPGLVNAVGTALSGVSWQRCRTHFMTNLLARVPEAAQGLVASLARSIFAQPDSEQVWIQHRTVVDQLSSRFPEAAELLEQAAHDILAFTAFPKAIWRRTDVAGLFPNREAIIRLVGALLCEQNDEWSVSRRYMSLDTIGAVLAACNNTNDPTLSGKEEAAQALAATA